MFDPASGTFRGKLVVSVSKFGNSGVGWWAEGTKRIVCVEWDGVLDRVRSTGQQLETMSNCALSLRALQGLYNKLSR